jgi:hypothetical protein
MLKDDLYFRVMDHVWDTGRTFWNYYQDLSHGKVLFCWKAFGLLAIGELIMNAHPFLPL